MDKTNKILLAVLAVLVLAYILKPSKAAIETRFKFFAADSASVNYIEVSANTGSVKLQNTNSGWKLTEPISFSANQSKIKTILSEVLKLKTSSTPIAEGKKALEKYKLTDSLAVFVRLLDESHNALDEVYINRSNNYSFCYVRKKDDDKIYRLSNNIFFKFGTDAKPWRNRNVFEIDQSMIAKIKVKSENKDYSLISAGKNWRYKSKVDEFDVSPINAQLSQNMRSLTKIVARQFIDEGNEEYKNVIKTFDKPILKLEIVLKSGAKQYLTIAWQDKTKFYLKLNNDSKHIYQIDDKFVDRFTVGFQKYQN